MEGVVYALLGTLVISLVLGGIFVRDLLTKQQNTVDHVASTVAEAVVAGIRGTMGYDQPVVTPDPGEVSSDEPIEPELPAHELDDLFVPGSTEEFAMNKAGWMNAKQGDGRTTGYPDAGNASETPAPSSDAPREDR